MASSPYVHITLDRVPEYVAERKLFSCDENLNGTYFNQYSGRMPESRREGFYRATEAHDFYAVYSYGTPIAWHAHGTWTMPDVRYNHHTSRHQRIVREAINL